MDVAVTGSLEKTESGSSSSTYIAYVIRVDFTSNGKTWTVHRRYSQFDALHRTLRKEFPFIQFPSFPSKTWWTSPTNPAIVSARRAAFAAYLRALLENPSLASSSTLIDFLEPAEGDPSPTSSSSSSSNVSRPSPKGASGPSVTPTKDSVATLPNNSSSSSSSAAVVAAASSSSSSNNESVLPPVPTPPSKENSASSSTASTTISTEKEGQSSSPTPSTEQLITVATTTASEFVALLKRIPKTERGPALDKGRSSDGLTPLMAAVEAKNLDCIRVALAAGANPNGTKNSSGDTPLHMAARLGMTRGTVLLHEASSPGSLLVRNAEKQTPFDVARTSPTVPSSKPDLIRWLGSSTLMHAVKTKALQQAKEILSHNVAVNDVDVAGRTALYYAARAGDPVLAKALLDAGALPGLADDAGMGPLHVAAASGHVSFIQVLKDDSRLYGNASSVRPSLEVTMAAGEQREQPPAARAVSPHKGSVRLAEPFESSVWSANFFQPPDPETPPPTETPTGSFKPMTIGRIRGSNNASILEALAAAEAATPTPPEAPPAPTEGAAPSVPSPPRSVTRSSKKPTTPTMVDSRKSVRSRKDALPKDVIAGERVDVNASTKDGATALVLAAAAGQVEAVKILSSVPGVDLDAKGAGGRRALAAAASAGHTAVVRELLDAGANVKATNAEGQTALHGAGKYGKAGAFHALVAAGGNPEEADVHGRSAQDYLDQSQLFVAAEAGDVKTLSEFAKVGTKLGDIVDTDGRGLLHAAAAFGHSDLVALLVKAGCRVDATTEEFEQTALHMASGEGHTKVINALLSEGAHVDMLDEDADSPLHYAAKKVDPSATAALVEGGADVSMTNNDEQTPLHVLAVTVAREVRERAKYGRPWTGVPSALIKTVRLLIDAGAKVDAKDAAGKKPSDYVTGDESLVALFDGSMVIGNGASVFGSMKRSVKNSMTRLKKAGSAGVAAGKQLLAAAEQ